MSKKKTSTVPLSLEALQKEAERFVTEKHFKDAIEAYKQLLKKEQRAEWQAGLAEAYWERAQELAKKGMFKEAIALWENRFLLCNDTSKVEHCIGWLLKIKQFTKAVQLFKRSVQTLQNTPAGEQLTNRFAILALAGSTQLMDIFPNDSPVRLQLEVARKVIHAYCQGDNEQVDILLSQIPFRSPFRDLRFIIKALLLLETDLDAAEQLLEKVPANSPFIHFTQLIKTAGLKPEIQLFNSLSQLGQSHLTFVSRLKGWDEKQLKIIRLILQAAHKLNNAKELFEIVLNHQDFFGEHYSRQFCRALLSQHLPGLAAYERKFGDLTLLDKTQIFAIAAERRRILRDVMQYWRMAAALLQEDSTIEQHKLKAALVFRYLAPHTDIYKIEYLEKSLELDPDDKETYIQLILEHKKGMKERVAQSEEKYHHWLAVTTARFPNDSEILLLAIESAMQRRAFKEVSQLAETVLRVDPINTKARRIRLSAHIWQARLFIQEKEYTLASAELEQAERLERSTQCNGIIRIDSAIIASKNRRPQLAKQLLIEGFNLAGQGMRGYLRIIVESLNCGADVKKILKLLPEEINFKEFCNCHVPTPEMLLEWIAVVNAYQDENVLDLTTAISYLKKPLLASAKQTFEENELLAICESLKRTQAYDFLLPFAKRGVHLWPYKAIFNYYYIFARCDGDGRNAKPKDIEELEFALHSARLEGDEKTLIEIMNFMKGIEAIDILSEFGEKDTDEDIEGLL